MRTSRRSTPCSALGDVDAVWQLGDVVGYGPHPDEVVARLREIGATGVRGNHDAAVLGSLGVEWFNPAARRAVEWTARRIFPETRAWLADLPERAELGEMTLVHGSPRDPTWEYITTTPTAQANLAVLVTPYLLYGHTHVPAAWRDGDGHVEALGPSDGSILALDGRRLLLNPGSVGSRAMAIRGPARWSWTRRCSASPGTAWPTRSRRPRPTSGLPGCPAGWPIA